MARARTGCSGARATRGLRRAGSARAGTPRGSLELAMRYGPHAEPSAPQY